MSQGGVQKGILPQRQQQRCGAQPEEENDIPVSSQKQCRQRQHQRKQTCIGTQLGVEPRGPVPKRGVSRIPEEIRQQQSNEMVRRKRHRREPVVRDPSAARREAHQLVRRQKLHGGESDADRQQDGGPDKQNDDRPSSNPPSPQKAEDQVRKEPQRRIHRCLRMTSQELQGQNHPGQEEVYEPVPRPGHLHHQKQRRQPYDHVRKVGGLNMRQKISAEGKRDPPSQRTADAQVECTEIQVTEEPPEEDMEDHIVAQRDVGGQEHQQ